MKNKGKDNSQQIMLYVILFGLIVMALVYFFVFKKYNDKSAALRISNTQLQARVNELKDYYDNQPIYEEKISEMVEDINKRFEDIPADVREEDVVMLAVKSLNNADADYTNINIADRQALYSISPETVQNANVDGYDQAIIIVARNASYVNKCDYINLKSIADVINNKPEKCSIGNISYSKNETDNILEGTIEVAFYSAVGTGKEYVEVDMKEYEAGLEDLFKLKVLDEEEQPEETEESAQ